MKSINKFCFNRNTLSCFTVCLLLLLPWSGKKEPNHPLIKAQQIISATAPGKNSAHVNSPNSPLSAMFWLYMKAGDFKALAAKRDKDKRKLIFQFCLTPKHPDTLTLRGWAGKGDDEYDNTKFILDILKLDTDVYDKEIYFSSQKLIADDVNALLKDIGTDDSKYVVFDPQPSPADYHIFYNVSVVTTSQFLVMKASEQNFAPPSRITTNPSPPASSRNNDRN